MGSKQRPAIVVSSDAYQSKRRDVVILAVTSKAMSAHAFGDTPIEGWKKAGLLKPSVAKPVVATVEQRLVKKRLGRLSETDREAVRSTLRMILG